MDTDHLIHELAGKAAPVRRLACPWIRTAQWLAISLPAIALIVSYLSLREDLAQVLQNPRYVIEQAAAFATAIAAAFVAFTLVVPGRSRAFLLLPLAPLAVWLGSLSEGCITSLLTYGLDGLDFYPDWVCFPYIALAGSVPAITIVVMLRRGAPLLPHTTLALGALAAAALGNFGLRLFHAQDASLMVLVWQFGSVALMVAVAGAVGNQFLYWRHAVAFAR
jgi:hypothetical protein